MNLDEFQKLVRDEFRFLVEVGFEEMPQEAGSIYVTYIREDITIEIKWEDWGTFIYGYVERADRDGRVGLNDYIKALSPTRHREIHPAYFPSGFQREDVVRYLATCLRIVFEDFWKNRDALWKELTTAKYEGE